MKAPENLRPGDKVAIVSTARKISKQEIEFAVKTLESWDLQVVLGDTIGLEHNQYAGTDQQRAKDFQQMLNDVNIKAIICARGGYGTVRIIDMIDFSRYMQQPKWIVGYSDVTVLHAHLNCMMGIQSIHGSMPINFEKNSEAALQSLRGALFGEPEDIKDIAPHPLNRNGECSGKIIGGNLSILYSLTGTKTSLPTSGHILFLEDLDEYLYHIDRMMMNLRRAGKLNDLAGLIIGGMTDMNDNKVPYGKQAEEIIAEYMDTHDYPVCYGFPAGHINDNRSLIFGRQVRLKVTEEGSEVVYA